ncbi:MAG: phage tail protein [Gloeotrichia echinulata GP01]
MNVKRSFSAVVAFLLAVTLIFGTQVNSASAQTSTSGVPVGTITTYAGSVKGNARGQLERQGWLVADGQTINRTDYSALFAIIGNIYGDGDKVTTFNLPDLRGRFVRGVDDAAGRDPDAKSRTASGSGGNTGDNVGSVQEDDFKSHTHKFSINGNTNATTPYKFEGAGGAIIEKVTQNTGGNETRPKNIYLNYIIKAKNVQ